MLHVASCIFPHHLASGIFPFWSISASNTHFASHSIGTIYPNRLNRLFLSRPRALLFSLVFFLVFSSRVLPTHTDGCTHRRLYTQMPIHTDACTHRCLYTQTPIHADACTYRCLYTPMPVQTEGYNACMPCIGLGDIPPANCDMHFFLM